MKLKNLYDLIMNFSSKYIICLNDLQAKFILGTDIRKLSKGYLNKYKSELASISKEIQKYEKIVYGDGSEILRTIF